MQPSSTSQGRAPAGGAMQLPQVGRVLPGPAGKLQELAAAGALEQATPEVLGLKAGSSTGVSPSQAANQYDAAFLSSSWAAAQARAEEDAVVAGPVRSVKSAKELGLGKVPRMLVLLSSFTPSGAGSAFSKVKDPSGTLGAALHASALQQQPLIGPGCIMLLQNVSVLTPHPGSCYLAVTADNIVQVWGPGQPARSIRNAAHQPPGTQHPQQRQQQQQPMPGQQQRQQVTQHTQPQQQFQQPPQQTQQQQQQQQLGQFHKGRPGLQQRPGTAAAAAAAAAAESGAGSRHTGSFFEPPSPDVMSVLNQLSSKGPAAAAAAGAGAGAAAGMRNTGGTQQQHWQQQQQQHPSQPWQHRRGVEHQGEVSPALSGAPAPLQQQPPLGSMPPPPRRAPTAAGQLGGSQQQQQQPWQQGGSTGPTQQHPSLQQQQQQQRSQGQQQHSQGQPLFQGMSQPSGAPPGPPTRHQTQAGPGFGGALGGSWSAGSGSGLTVGAAGGGSVGAGSGAGGSRALPGRPATAAGAAAAAAGAAAAAAAAAARAAAMASCADEDEDVDIDENIVAAIFGSRVPQARATQAAATAQQQQQRGPVSSVSGAALGGTQGARVQGSAAAAGAKPALSAISGLGSQQQQQQQQGQGAGPGWLLGAASGGGGSSGGAAASGGSGAAGAGFGGTPFMASGQVPKGTPVAGTLGGATAAAAAAGGAGSAGGFQGLGGMGPPADVQGQQRWGRIAPGSQQQQQRPQGGGASGGGLGKGGAAAFGGSVFGKRAAQLSLLDDLVADELDDF